MQADEREFVVECDVPDSEEPIRQGDVLEWLETDDSRFSDYAVVVTADCDIAHQKHSGVLACVPALHHRHYLQLFPLRARLDTARAKLFERLLGMVRELQATNREDFPTPLSAEAVQTWVATAESAEEIAASLRVNDEKTSSRLAEAFDAIRRCDDVGTRDFDEMLRALTGALLITQNESDFEKRRAALGREIMRRLATLPGDAVFIHALAPTHTGGYVIYLRSVLNVRDSAIARSVRELRSGAAEAKRIGRLSSPYVFHVSQKLGEVFSAIGLPTVYETSRGAFIEMREGDFAA